MRKQDILSLKEGGCMEKAKRKVRVCLICVVMIAIVVGIFYYYYNELGNENFQREGTLIRSAHVGWERLWH